ncbi:hypothetical protein FKP32DRAFT_1590413 [Trametes sanguinea]|nr:hypothetical protein FKP32DRAFT_1590413 [Trametes sanguinea]
MSNTTEPQVASTSRAATDDAPSVPRPPSELEAASFYDGLPSKPPLVARSSTYVWEPPTGPDGQPLAKMLCPFPFDHAFKDVWQDKVAPEVTSYLDAKGVKFNYIMPICFRYADPDEWPPTSTPVLWMGVEPGSLSAEEGVEVAVHCREILLAHDVDDIHVEICESRVHRSPYVAPSEPRRGKKKKPNRSRKY